jgi:hypothetical protein
MTKIQVEFFFFTSCYVVSDQFIYLKIYWDMGIRVKTLCFMYLLRIHRISYRVFLGFSPSKQLRLGGFDQTKDRIFLRLWIDQEVVSLHLLSLQYESFWACPGLSFEDSPIRGRVQTGPKSHCDTSGQCPENMYTRAWLLYLWPRRTFWPIVTWSSGFFWSN